MTRACQISSRAAFPPACLTGAGIKPRAGSPSNAWNVNFNNGNTNNNAVSNTNNVRCVR